LWKVFDSEATLDARIHKIFVFVFSFEVLKLETYIDLFRKEVVEVQTITEKEPSNFEVAVVPDVVESQVFRHVWKTVREHEGASRVDVDHPVCLLVVQVLAGNHEVLLRVVKIQRCNLDVVSQRWVVG